MRTKVRVSSLPGKSRMNTCVSMGIGKLLTQSRIYIPQHLFQKGWAVKNLQYLSGGLENREKVKNVQEKVVWDYFT